MILYQNKLALTRPNLQSYYTVNASYSLCPSIEEKKVSDQEVVRKTQPTTETSNPRRKKSQRETR